MQAMVFKSFGPATVIHTATLPVPPVAPTTVLVKVTAVAVDHVDTFVRSGRFQTPLADPHIVGRDLVGRVRAVGSAVTQFHVGQTVWSNSMGYDGRMGATAEMVAVPADRLYSAPATIDPYALVAAVHSAATAAIVLDSVMHLTAGETLLVEGGAGNVGRKLVALGAAAGATVYATANPRDFARLRTLGATPIDYHADLTTLALPPVDHAIDTSGHVALQTNADLLGQGGQIVQITTPPAQPSTLNIPAFYMQMQRLTGFVISHASVTQLHQAATTLNHAFARGQLLDDQLLVRPFSTAATAHHALETGQDDHHRLVLVPDSTFH